MLEYIYLIKYFLKNFIMKQGNKKNSSSIFI